MLISQANSNSCTRYQERAKYKRNKQVHSYTLTCSLNNSNLFLLIRRTFENLQHATIAKDIFQKNKIIDSEHHPANLGQLHCSSKIASSFQSFIVFCCGKNCFCFHYIKEDSTEFILNSNFHCEASNLIYVIICSFIKQAEQYIKQAEGKLKDKLYIHCQEI